VEECSPHCLAFWDHHNLLNLHQGDFSHPSQTCSEDPSPTNPISQISQINPTNPTNPPHLMAECFQAFSEAHNPASLPPQVDYSAAFLEAQSQAPPKTHNSHNIHNSHNTHNNPALPQVVFSLHSAICLTLHNPHKANHHHQVGYFRVSATCSAPNPLQPNPPLALHFSVASLIYSELENDYVFDIFVLFKLFIVSIIFILFNKSSIFIFYVFLL
jgi:hypothetical protein